jgi:hypothetical protein
MIYGSGHLNTVYIQLRLGNSRPNRHNFHIGMAKTKPFLYILSKYRYLWELPGPSLILNLVLQVEVLTFSPQKHAFLSKSKTQGYKEMMEGSLHRMLGRLNVYFIKPKIYKILTYQKSNKWQTPSPCLV